MEIMPYPEYKNSGVDWLGEVPKHWNVSRIRFFIKSSPGKSEIKNVTRNNWVSFVPMDAVNEYGGINLDINKTLDDVHDGYTYFRNNDIVIAKITPCFENGKGALANDLTNGIAFGTTELHVIRSLGGCCTKWLFYLSVSYAFRKIGTAEMIGAGGQKRIPENFVKNFRLGMPKLEEQTQITKFLDHKTTQINRLIEKKKTLIEKLNEKRTALITQAVTKGLNPDAPMKDSGVDWLGEVPEHWEVRRLKLIANIFTGKTPKRSDENNYSQEGLLWIKPDDLHENNPVTNTKDRLTSTGANDVPIIPGYSPLVCCIGTVGKFGYAKEKSSTNQQINAIVYNSQIDPIFGLYLASANKSIYYKIANKSVVPIVNTELQGAIVCPLPPKEEQIQIAAFLDHKTAQIDKLINKTSEAIDTLNEYRTALITAAVTGKIDVRNISIPEQLASL